MAQLVDVDLVAGDNKIKLVVADQGGGPNIDHLRVGKPPAVVMKTNGWPRLVARNGLFLLDNWNETLTQNWNETTASFDYYPDAPQGDLYRYNFGRLRLRLPGGNYFLEIGNPAIDFNGYEQFLPPHYVNFTAETSFVESASELYPYPIHQGQELLLLSGLNDNAFCDAVPPFAEEFDAPIFGMLPSGEWLSWSATILFEDNGPSVNDVDMKANVLSDGGGSAFVATGEKLKCSNVPRSFVNEATCFLSTESTACSASQPVGEVMIPVRLDL